MGTDNATIKHPQNNWQKTRSNQSSTSNLRMLVKSFAIYAAVNGYLELNLLKGSSKIRRHLDVES